MTKSKINIYRVLLFSVSFFWVHISCRRSQFHHGWGTHTRKCCTGCNRYHHCGKLLVGQLHTNHLMAHHQHRYQSLVEDHQQAWLVESNQSFLSSWVGSHTNRSLPRRPDVLHSGKRFSNHQRMVARLHMSSALSHSRNLIENHHYKTNSGRFVSIFYK